MVEGREQRQATRLGTRGSRVEEVSLAEEADIVLVLNKKVVAQLSATPVDLEELAVGHLALAGRLAARKDVQSVLVRRWREGFRVEVEALDARGKGTPFPPAKRTPRLGRAQVLGLMRELNDTGTMYREGGGVHTSGLADVDGLRAAVSDVGKVNTLDRLAGALLLRGAPVQPIALTTGRVTGAIASRAAALGCRVLISHSGPTTAGLAVAADTGMRVIGYVRGGSFDTYGSAAAARRLVKPG